MYNVLIVDDEEIIRIELRRLLRWEELGFHICGEAGNGQDALEFMRSQPVDMVLTDIKMPRINGFEFLKEVKDNGLCACVVFLSGYADFEFTRQALVLGAFDYILKPLERQMVEEVLHRARTYLSDGKKGEIIAKGEQKGHSPVVEAGSPYLEDRIRFLLTGILAGDGGAVAFAEEIFVESCESCEQDLSVITRQIYGIMAGMTDKVVEKFPALKKVAAFERSDSRLYAGLTDLSQIRAVFADGVDELVTLVSTYHLNLSGSLVGKVCLYVLEHMDDEITLQEISEKFFISRNYFCTVFKQETGENFIEYVTKVKMERARVLLKEYDYKAYEIGKLLGYQETPYFSKLFKRHTGLSPSEYRKQQTNI